MIFFPASTQENIYKDEQDVTSNSEAFDCVRVAVFVIGLKNSWIVKSLETRPHFSLF